MIPKYDEFKELINESFYKSADEKRLSSIDMTKQTPLFRLLARQYAIYLEGWPHKSIVLPFNVHLSDTDVDREIEEMPSYDKGDYWTPPSSESGYVSFSVPDFELRLDKAETDNIINGADIDNMREHELYINVVDEIFDAADTTDKNNSTTYYISFKNAYFGGSCNDDVESHFELVDTNIVDMNEKDALDLLTHIFEYALVTTFRECDVCAFDIDSIWDKYEDEEPDYDRDDY